jgi:uncharacterized protein
MMNEHPFFLRNNDYRLFCVLHMPDSASSSPKGLMGHPYKMGFIFCNSFAEEGIISHRVLVNLARKLSNEGYACLRFNYMGEGDSDNSFEESDIATRLSDISCVVEYLRNEIKIEKIGLLGVRLGATFAAMSCRKISDIDRLVLISPIVNGKKYADQLLRSNLSFQMAAYGKIRQDRKTLVQNLISGNHVNVDGYLLTKKIYQQLEEINLVTTGPASHPEVLILEILRRKNRAIPNEINSLYEMYKENSCNSKLMSIEEAFFWKDGRFYHSSAKNVENEITEWLHHAVNE